jgi:hypothetical protein
MSDITTGLAGALLVPNHYHLLMEFAAGRFGWFVPWGTRRAVHEVLLGLATLRALSGDVPPTARVPGRDGRGLLEAVADGRCGYLVPEEVRRVAGVALREFDYRSNCH